jgi:hypothetical protein
MPKTKLVAIRLSNIMMIAKYSQIASIGVV